MDRTTFMASTGRPHCNIPSGCQREEWCNENDVCWHSAAGKKKDTVLVAANNTRAIAIGMSRAAREFRGVARAAHEANEQMLRAMREVIAIPNYLLQSQSSDVDWEQFERELSRTREEALAVVRHRLLGAEPRMVVMDDPAESFARSLPLTWTCVDCHTVFPFDPNEPGPEGQRYEDVPYINGRQVTVHEARRWHGEIHWQRRTIGDVCGACMRRPHNAESVRSTR